MIAAIKTRLAAQVPELSGRIEGAANFVDMLARNALPTQTPAANVIPTGLQGGKAGAISGAFTQSMSNTIAVMLTLRTYDRTGEKGVDRADVLIRDIVNGLAGWAPGDEVGVFVLRNSRLVNMSAGTLVYQIEFSIDEQLRILS